MKKVFSIIIVSMLLVMLFIPVSAAPAVNNIPKAYEAPTLDGVIDPEEWAGALVMEMKAGDPNISVPAGDPANFEGATFYFMWDEAGIWFACSVTDSSESSTIPASGTGSYNQGDGVQFNFYPNRETSGTALGDLFFFTYHPKTADGIAEVGEHFVYGDGVSGQPVPEAKIASKFTGTNYVVEGLIPTSALAKSTIPIVVASGARLIWNNVIMFCDEAGAQGLAADSGWFTADTFNEYVFVDTVAGKVPPPPVVEEIVEEGVTEVPATKPIITSPQTGNALAGAIILILGSAGVITYASKKKR